MVFGHEVVALQDFLGRLPPHPGGGLPQPGRISRCKGASHHQPENSPEGAQNRQAPVLIPAFPGTNCERHTARAFEAAGAVPEIPIIRNRTPQEVADSVQEMARLIREAQIGADPRRLFRRGRAGWLRQFITSS